MGKPLGIIIYQGPSQIDGKPIVAIANGIKNKSENSKVGDMIQVWIMRADIHPILANKLGYDYSICGDCKHRHFGSCYVNLGHGPLNVFEAFHRQRYVKYTPDMIEYFKDRHIRLGSYGDPAAVPIEIWDNLCSVAAGYTGYTHQWATCDPDLKNYCMGSVDNKTEHYKATGLGWRTFRIRLEEEDVLDTEFICPASKEAGKLLDCTECKACSGLKVKNRRSACIKAHGVDFKIKRFIAGMKKIRNKKKWRREYIKI